LIAERTGLPRETVRRKVRRLVDRALLDVDEEGHVRSIQILSNSGLAQNLENVRRFVGRYFKRVS
jgi:DNA-binding IclR family transcriptional regulator